MSEIVAASEGGREIDSELQMLDLPRIGVRVGSRFLSRLRGAIQTTGSVIG